MSWYIKKMAEAAKKIIEITDEIGHLQGEREAWAKPECRTFDFGGKRYYLVRKDGTVTPGLEAFQAEALKAIDRQIESAHSRLEGSRYALVQLGKETRYD